MTTVITDRQIQDAAHRAYDAGDTQVETMLRELIEFRKTARAAVGQHDHEVMRGNTGYGGYYNRSMVDLMMHVYRAGCEWFQCTRVANTRRVRAEAFARGETSHLCSEHADEGESKDLWDEAHLTNVRWKQLDMDGRESNRKQAAERAALEAEVREEEAHEARCDAAKRAYEARACRRPL